MNNDPRSAFSLIELMLVLVIASLVAGSLAFKWRTSMGPFLQQETIRKLALADRQTREFAESNRCNCLLEFDPDSSTLNSIRTLGGLNERVSYWIDSSIAVSDFDVIEYSPAGVSTTWSVAVGEGDEKIWLLFAGQTGQVTQFEDKAKLDEILETLRVEGADAR
ncbi:MAG: type II secretion system protein [Planctomycetota bacterium]